MTRRKSRSSRGVVLPPAGGHGYCGLRFTTEHLTHSRPTWFPLVVYGFLLMHAGDKARDQLTCDVMNSELTELMQQEHFRKLKVYIHRLKETLQIITFSLIDCC